MNSDGSDQRRFGRLESRYACTFAARGDACAAELVNISRSGAAVHCRPGAASVGDEVTLLIVRNRQPISMTLSGSVARIQPKGDQLLYGVQFRDLSADETDGLVQLLSMLQSQPGEGRRAHPRISARVMVRCTGSETFRAWLNDVSRGGLSLWCERPLPPGEHLAVTFELPGLGELFEVAGVVVSSQPSGKEHRVGLKFDPLDARQCAVLERHLDAMLGL